MTTSAKARPRTASRSRARTPTQLNLYAYQVGFGDCFLLQFLYGSEDSDRRHVLIDFGTTGLKADSGSNRMQQIAEDIRNKCGRRGLDAIVATHRHADHISGFATRVNGDGPGDIIRSLKPRVVLQPWTEDLALATNASGPGVGLRAPRGTNLGAAAALTAMNGLAEQVASWAQSRPKGLPMALIERLDFLGRDNTKNVSAVENLAHMGESGRRVYAHYGVDDPFKTLLPGVKTKVLGPPTVEQYPAIQKQRSSDDAEFWHFQSRAATTAGTVARGRGPFAAEYVFAKHGKLPRESRWAADRINGARGTQLLGIVTMLDRAMNNTSLILLFEIAGKRLLFPGDAQIENWSYALSQPGIAETLAEVDLYKVGHHGSLNATPRSLWSQFKKRGGTGRPDRMTSVLSTMAGKHGSEDKRTEVPRRTLVEMLKDDTHFHSTQEMDSGDLCTKIEIRF